MIERSRIERLPVDDSKSANSAAAHGAEIITPSRLLTVRELAARWGISEEAIRCIPVDQLPHFRIGTGRRRIHRRYHPRDVVAYEQGRRKRR